MISVMLRLGTRNIQPASTTDFQMLRPLAPNISRQGVNTLEVLPTLMRLRPQRFHRWSMVKSGAFPFSFNSINTLTVRYVIPPDIESDCQS